MRVLFALLALAMSAPLAHADLYVSKRYVNFGRVDVNRSRVDYVRVTNRDKDAVRVDVYDSCFGDYMVSDSCISLDSNESCQIRIRFSPRREGYSNCSIRLSDSKGNRENISVSGYGADRR